MPRQPGPASAPRARIRSRRRRARPLHATLGVFLAAGTTSMAAAFPVMPADEAGPSRPHQMNTFPARDSAGDPSMSQSDEALAEGLQRIEDIWNADRFETSVDSNSNAEGVVNLDKGKGKGKDDARSSESFDPLRHPFLRKAEKGRTMQYTSQRPPFHTSEVGRYASRSPTPLSVGLFRPDYPFLPSGRRRPKTPMYNATDAADAGEYRPEPTQHGSLYTLPPDVVGGNVFKHGWTSAMLDDDNRLSVPDEYRRPRRTSALSIARKLAGHKWYRWKPGEGYVLSTRKDYSVYKHGPGLALGQLLPPREHPYTSRLPLIPNDAKRDFAWMVFWCIFVVALLTLGSEVRALWRSRRKGKRRDIGIPMIRILHDDRQGQVLTSSLASGGSIGLRTRQRLQARSMRDICKAALVQPLNRTGSPGPYLTTRRTSPGTAKGEKSSPSNYGFGRLRRSPQTREKGFYAEGSHLLSKRRSSAEHSTADVQEQLLEDGTLCVNQEDSSGGDENAFSSFSGSQPTGNSGNRSSGSSSSSSGSTDAHSQMSDFYPAQQEASGISTGSAYVCAGVLKNTFTPEGSVDSSASSSTAGSTSSYGNRAAAIGSLRLGHYGE